ncbi:MAG: class II D-tagatose-bisphosphate aldolase, non-catalytic subunit [Eubacteriales bacterium]|nr:class II D-tagatose-bisphosphate aldolase, non-catalytic subunit [Eubacteriales bacterium]MDD3197919.1 class II D-tagatose-bisphosphate aldolase, non-catalytic subunit [Eubacteriales bacterium]MDD3503101.1 class II D-tagatose-bisphosphate aldolase, non-catalytic subunit [Eubacteriales bacterium]MDD4683418.1 class II D-tagatose-bisphosphate aldolase, non-catalytic subunit [Eubacteriales bacterium]
MSSLMIDMVRKQKQGQAVGIYSACTANEIVLRSVLQRALACDQPALIEATANQVDQNGGYTGMKPADFAAYVYNLADEMSFPKERLILGGDHLGPLTRTSQSEEQAMAYADELVRQYVLAGFTKIHLDTSMRLADDDQHARLSDEVIAARGARLCKVAEDTWQELKKVKPEVEQPVYIIGSEVPIPGGAQSAEESISVTTPEDCRTTLTTFEDKFRSLGLDSAWERVIGLVVQPGVEFGDSEVHEYDRKKAAELTASLKDWQQGVFEGHSTDYQTPQGLREMVEDGIAILKVGPALTFALREALFALEAIERELLTAEDAPGGLSDFRAVLEKQMLANPGNWQKHYHGDSKQLAFARAYSFSDRARYYLPDPEVDASIRRLFTNMSQNKIPLSILSQYMPWSYQAHRAGRISAAPEQLIMEHIGHYIDEYLYAVIPDSK